jgi:hypothetical protein
MKSELLSSAMVFNARYAFSQIVLYTLGSKLMLLEQTLLWEAQATCTASSAGTIEANDCERSPVKGRRHVNTRS